MRKRNGLIAAIVLGLATVALVVGTGNISADESDGQGQVERIALRQEKMEQHLDQAVSEGKITQEQRQGIVDRKNEMKKLREEFREWAESEGIDLKELFPHGKKHGRGFGHHGR